MVSLSKAGAPVQAVSFRLCCWCYVLKGILKPIKSSNNSSGFITDLTGGELYRRFDFILGALNIVAKHSCDKSHVNIGVTFGN